MILIKNPDFIVTPKQVLRNKNIIIEENKISKIGKATDKSDYVIDAKGFAVLPGLVNSHTHLAMTLFRGYADDMELMQFLQKIWKIEAKLTEKDCYIGSLLGCLEMIKSGTTCFDDMYFYMDATARACEKSGIRGNLAWAILDKEITTQPGDPVGNCEQFIKRWSNHELVKPLAGPHAIYTCSTENLLRTKELAEKYKCGIHIHLSETQKEVKDCLKKNKLRPVEYLKKIGFLGKNILAAHCVWLDKKEIKILASSGIQAAHCPTSNLKLASGIAPVAEMLKAGIKVGLGTDGCASNNNLDLFEEIKLLALIQKQITSNPIVLPARQAISCAAGQITEGAQADLILINLKKPHLTPLHNIISNLVYSAGGQDVDTVICNGKILMQGRKVLTLNEQEILKKAKRAAERLVK